MEDFDLNGGAVDDIVANVDIMLKNDNKKNDASLKDKKKDNFELDLDKVVKPVSVPKPGNTASQAQTSNPLSANPIGSAMPKV